MIHETLAADTVLSPDDFALVDDGTLDTVVQYVPNMYIMRFSAGAAAPYRDAETGELDLEPFVSEECIPWMESDAEIWSGE